MTTAPEAKSAAVAAVAAAGLARMLNSSEASTQNRPAWEAENAVMKAEAAASKDYAVFEQRPDLAVFLLQLKALKESLKDRATLILDEKIPPLNLLNTEKTQTPATR